MAHRARASLPVGATLLAAFLWGTSFLVNDAGLAHVGPATFAATRFLLAGLVAVVALVLLRRLDLALARRPLLWGLALANGSAFLLQYFAQTRTTPARTALFVNSAVFAVAILERLLYKERLGLARVVWILLGAGGAAVLVATGDPEGLAGGQVLGDLLALASGILWSVYAVFNRAAVRNHDPAAVTGLTFALTGLVLVPALALDAEPLRADAAGWGAIVYAGLVTTALAYGLWAYGLRSIRATTSAVLLLFEILVASAISVAIGRESFQLVDLVGATMLVGALVGMTLVAEKEAA